MLTLASCRLVPIIINPVLVSFRQSLSLIIQDLIALMQHSMALTLSLCADDQSASGFYIPMDPAQLVY